MRELLSAFAVPFLCDNLIDLLWLAGDLAGEKPISIVFSQSYLTRNTTGLLFYGIENVFWYFDPEGSQLDTIQNILLWCLIISLPILFISRICLWFQSRKMVSKRPFNLRELKGISTLFGHSLWKERLM